jgi:hypothetical protein
MLLAEWRNVDCGFVSQETATGGNAAKQACYLLMLA